MSKERILVVDDEADLREIVSFNLEAAGYAADTAASAREALSMLDKGYSLILLDVMMEGMSGFQMAQVVREGGSNVPIIFLTAKTAEGDLLEGFSKGGDDYITKPFSMSELLARVAAVIKRAGLGQEAPRSNVVTCGDMTIDLDTKVAYISGAAVSFSKTEFEILVTLASQPGRIFSRQDIIDAVWKGSSYVLPRTVDVHIARIRNKMGDWKTHLSNKSGYGYCIYPEGKA